MKVKIGKRIYDGARVPIMVILTPADRRNIRDMEAGASMYAEFPNDWGGVKQMRAWMCLSKRRKLRFHKKGRGGK